MQETTHHAAPMTPIEFKPFRRWTLEINQRAAGLEQKELEKFPERLLEVERRARIAAERSMLFRYVRTGLHLEVGPPLDEDYRWLPLFFLATAEADWARPPYRAGVATALKDAFHGARKAFLARDADKFAEKSAEFMKQVAALHDGYAERLRKERADTAERSQAKVSSAGLSIFDFLDEGKEWNAFPTPAMVDTEVFYNQFQPFWKTVLVGFIASLLLAISMGLRFPPIYWLGFASLLAAIGLMSAGLWMRVMISGRAPVTNMFETVLWASLVAAVVGVVLALVYKQRVLSLSAAIVLALASTIAVNMPANMGESIRPLEPVLQSQKWLIIHVMTIVASYGAFMLAWLLSTIGLAYYFRPVPDKKACKEVAAFVYRAMQVGVVLLFAGTALGGWWAADSWGRFWGWDAKEVWALIALLTYLAVLHARHVGLKSFGTMVGSSLAFTMIVGSWYGVNFLFPAGLHAYAINSGGQMYVIGGVIGNLTYVFAVWLMRSLYRSRQHSATLESRESHAAQHIPAGAGAG
jgi:ABC-type transport system involved in cytochrome c biogenesis permease subunit